MDKKNYFIVTNLMRTNAFFISKDYSKDKYFPNIEIKNKLTVSDVNFREVEINGKLSFLSGKDKIEKIKEMYDNRFIKFNKKNY